MCSPNTPQDGVISDYSTRNVESTGSLPVLDPSRSSVTGDRFPSFNDDRHLPKATGILQHFLQLLAVRLHIIIGCFFSIG